MPPKEEKAKVCNGAHHVLGRIIKDDGKVFIRQCECGKYEMPIKRC